MRPYIGITGFTHPREVEEMSEVFFINRPADSRLMLHVGVMMSRKTLRGIPSRWQDVFPPKERIANIFFSYGVYNCLHYADYESDPDLSQNISTAISYGGIGMCAIQLDMIWPDPDEVARGVHDSLKQIEVILQIGQYAFDEADNDPQRVAERLETYQGVIHHVLLDRSMGRGIKMDISNLVPFARAIKNRFPNLGIGVAGGLGPDTVQTVLPIADEFRWCLSIDAQGQLCRGGNAFNPVDWNIARSYLVNALKVLHV